MQTSVAPPPQSTLRNARLSRHRYVPAPLSALAFLSCSVRLCERFGSCWALSVSFTISSSSCWDRGMKCRPALRSVKLPIVAGSCAATCRPPRLVAALLITVHAGSERVPQVCVQARPRQSCV